MESSTDSRSAWLLARTSSSSLSHVLAAPSGPKPSPWQVPLPPAGSGIHTELADKVAQQRKQFENEKQLFATVQAAKV